MLSRLISTYMGQAVRGASYWESGLLAQARPNVTGRKQLISEACVVTKLWRLVTGRRQRFGLDGRERMRDMRRGMELSDADIRSYIDYEIAINTSPRLKAWISLSHLRDMLESEMRDITGNESDILRGICDEFNIPGTSPSDFARRQIKVTETLSVLAGIQFVTPDPKTAFVNIFGQTGPINEENIETLRATLTRSFNIFGPRSFRMWASNYDHLLRFPGTTLDRIFVGAPLSVILERRPGDTPNLELIPQLDEGLYGEYKSEYEKFLSQNPEAGEWLRVESYDTLRGCLSEGGLFEIIVGGKRAGLIAARQQCIKGIDGWEVTEEFLFEAFRGQKLAPHIQRLFLERLPGSTDRIVFGTIGSENKASLKTALRVGRISLGAWVLLKISA
jgi:hypothetical protein